jgi:hypothetical protein
MRAFFVQWEANVLNDGNVFNEIPEDRYPFNPTANGHEWKKWDEGDTAAQRIKEMNVFDHGQGLAAINLGEHAVTGDCRSLDAARCLHVHACMYGLSTHPHPPRAAKCEQPTVFVQTPKATGCPSSAAIKVPTSKAATGASSKGEPTRARRRMSSTTLSIRTSPRYAAPAVERLSICVRTHSSAHTCRPIRMSVCACVRALRSLAGFCVVDVCNGAVPYCQTSLVSLLLWRLRDTRPRAARSFQSTPRMADTSGARRCSRWIRTSTSLIPCNSPTIGELIGSVAHPRH